jgi:type I restriction enzyme S subunit
VRPDWLQSIPSSWGSAPFGSIFTQSKKKNYRLQRDFVLSVIKDRGVIPYTEKGNVGNKVSDDLSGYKLVDRGDFVLNSMNLYMGSVGVSEYEGVTSTAYIVCKPSGDVFAGYYNYLIQFKGFQEYVGLLGKGIMEIREAVRWTALKSVFVPLPDLPTQRAIADFLDRETARIDLLIEKKQRLVALLDEKRSATVTAAIAGGIAGEGIRNGHCPFVEGAGKVTYWSENIRHSLHPLKHICHINPSVLPETTDPDWEFDYIDIGSVKLSEGVKQKERVRFEASPSRARKPVKEGDILVSTVRTYLKAIAAVEAAETPQVASTGFAVLRAGKGIDARFLYRVVQSNPFVEQVVSQSTGVSYPAINPSTLGDISIPVPNLSTQREVADFLDRETARIQNIQKMTRQSIERLKEYRSALITAAVTGQINVAEWSKACSNERQLNAIQTEMEH